MFSCRRIWVNQSSCLKFRRFAWSKTFGCLMLPRTLITSVNWIPSTLKVLVWKISCIFISICCNSLFYIEAKTTSFLSSVATFMNFSANFSFSVLKWRRMRMKGTEMGLRQEVVSHFFKTWFNTERRIPRKLTWIQFRCFAARYEIHGREIFRVLSSKPIYLTRT